MLENKEKPDAPDASIILVSYNNLRATTVPCLESVFAKTSGSYEVICVDNCSTDGTAEYLEAAARKEPRLIPVLNKTNKGFSGGNNDGLRIARGRHIVLLNNDTVVTEGWLEGLTTLLAKDESIGMVGPVSNSVGNEQRIDTAGKTLAEVLEEGEKWCAMSRDGVFDTDMLGFFCVAARKDTIDRVGLLDEAFGLGFYEDDDYCIRVRKAGYRLVCVEGVFIYHIGSGSFTGKSNRDLIRRNKGLLEEKLGVAYTPRRWKDKLLDIIESDIDKGRQTGLTPALKYRIENRIRLLEKSTPRGFFRGTTARLRVRRLKRAIDRLS